MQAVERLGSFISRGVCTVSGPFLPYGGAVDIVVVQQKDGSFKSSPWFVRFGKLHRVLKANEKKVNIIVNGVEPDFHMYMNHKGEAFFLREGHSEEQKDGDSISSESSSSSEEAGDVLPWGRNRHFKSKSFKFDSDRSSSADLVDVNNGKIVNRTSSRRSRLLRLVLGQRSFKGEVEDAEDLLKRAEIAANLLELKWSTNLSYHQLPRRDRKTTRGDTLESGFHPPKMEKEAVHDNRRTDLQVACVELEACIKKKSIGEEVSGVSTTEMGNNISEENISADGVQLPDYHAHAEILQARTGLQYEVTKTEDVIQNFDLGMPVMDVSELHSQQRDCSQSVLGMFDVVDVGNLPNFQKSHTISVYRTRRSVNKVRANTPTSEQLASLNLKEGRNTVTFSFSTAMLGTQQIDARIYLWKWNTRIVISDVDGTITRSDVLGQFMPLVGIDWSQTGVAHLFSAIQENGYQLLFLSARAISQAYYTRQFLFNLKQDGKVLPDGPVVISPDGLFPALYREVIRRAPHEFKIACLEGIKALFPPDCNPFYAGFGNRDTDEISYLKVGIPKGKIFIINPRGEIAVNFLDTKSYTSLHAAVNGMFPPTDSSEQEDFNSWNYWKMPLLL